MTTVNSLVEDLLSEGMWSTTLRHMGNRFITGNIFNSKWVNLKAALIRTANGSTSLEDIKFLRRDFNLANSTLEKLLSNTKDEDEKKHLKEYMHWLYNEYPKILNAKAKELSNA